MAEPWKQWEGLTVNGEFRLGAYLGGSRGDAVFQTAFGDPDSQTAAIKLIAANSPGAEQRLASWQLAANLSHPHLIRIFQAGHCQIGDTKLVYVVMEYAEENLSLVVPRRALTEIEVREMLDPALDALAYLHAKGLSHNRIKPANIMASGALRNRSELPAPRSQASMDRCRYCQPSQVSRAGNADRAAHSASGLAGTKLVLDYCRDSASRIGQLCKREITAPVLEARRSHCSANQKSARANLTAASASRKRGSIRNQTGNAARN